MRITLTLWTCLVLMVAPIWAGDLDYRVLNSVGLTKFIYYKANGNEIKSDFTRAGDSACANNRICIAMFWSDSLAAATSFPMTDKQLAEKKAHFNINKNTGFKRTLICDIEGC